MRISAFSDANQFNRIRDKIIVRFGNNHVVDQYQIRFLLKFCFTIIKKIRDSFFKRLFVQSPMFYEKLVQNISNKKNNNYFVFAQKWKSEENKQKTMRVSIWVFCQVPNDIRFEAKSLGCRNFHRTVRNAVLSRIFVDFHLNKYKTGERQWPISISPICSCFLYLSSWSLCRIKFNLYRASQFKSIYSINNANQIKFIEFCA